MRTFFRQLPPTIAPALLVLTTACVTTSTTPDGAAALAKASGEAPGGGAVVLELMLDAPACGAGLSDGGTVLVDGVDTGAKVAPGEGPVKVFPFQADAVLIAVPYLWTQNLGADGGPDGTLWRVVCSTREVRPFLQRQGADFGHAALQASERLLYFTDTSGVSALDLGSRAIIPITQAPPYPKDCWLYDPTTTHHLTDVLVDLKPDSTLVLHRGGPCGFEGDWTAREYHVSALGIGSIALKHRPQPVADVAIGHQDRVWLADAGRCDEPGVTDPQTEGAVWISDNGGDHWRHQYVRSDSARMITAAAQIFVDTKDGKRVLLRSHLCRSAAVQRGGSLFLTHDDGESWRQVTLPKEMSAVQNAGQGLKHIDAPDGGLSHLRAWTFEGKTFETRDGGASWTRVGVSGAPPSVKTSATASSGVVFTRTDDGLLRSHKSGDKRVRVFPQK